MRCGPARTTRQLATGIYDMPRNGLFLLLLFALTGCQAFGWGPPHRVPPPPTGAVQGSSPGNQGYYNQGYYDTAPRPQAGQGASNWPNSQFLPAANVAESSSSPQRMASATPAAASQAQLEWLDPSVGSGVAPNRLNSPGPTEPLVAGAPRIRFPNSAPQRPVTVPAELANLRNPRMPEGVRQATAYSNWQSRYEDVRR